MPLDLTPLRRAVASLGRALVRAQGAPEDEELRDACILRFAYTYELSWRMLKRQLARELPSPREVAGIAFRELFRAGGRGLVADVEAWFLYRAKRNLTTHTYNQATAEEVFAALPGFTRDAQDLLQRLAARDGP